MTVTAAELRDRQKLKPALLAEITLLNSGPTLYLADRTLPAAISGQLYEHYIKEINGLSEEVKRNDSTFLNSPISITFLNDKWAGYNYLIEAGSTYPFEGATVTIKEVLIDDDGTMATPVTVFKGALDEPRDIDLMQFTCKVSTTLYAKSRRFRQAIVDKLIYPNADTNDLNKYLNIVYGSVERIKCHAVRAGASDRLPDNIFAGSPAAGGTWVLTDASNFPASGAFTVQVDDEQIRITSRSGNTLTVASRGFGNTTADDHSRGATVFEVRTEYVYMAAGHPVKAIDACYVDGVLQTTGVTFYTGQSGNEHADFPGKAIVTFVSKPKVIKTGSISLYNPEHGHAPVGGSTTTTTENAMNLPSLSIDNAGTLGLIDVQNITFPAHSNIVAASYTISFTMSASGYKWVAKLGDQIIYSYDKGAGGASSYKNSPITFSYMTNTAYLPVRIEAYGDPYSAQSTDIILNILAASRTVTYSTTETVTPNTQDSELLGRASADTVIGQSINVDLRGYQDTAGGTYTGVANALIERPDQVLKHFLIAQLGYVSGDLDSSSFSASGTSFGAAISGGYKLGICITDKLDKDSIPRFIQQMGYESRSNIYERAGIWYIKYIPDAAPAAVKTISQAEIAAEYGKFIFSKSPIIGLKTMLDAKFRWNFDKMEGRLADWLGTSSTYKTAGTGNSSATPVDGGYVENTTNIIEHITNKELVPLLNNIVQNPEFATVTDSVQNGTFGTANTKAINPTLTATDKITNGSFTTVINKITNGTFDTADSWLYGSGWFFDGSLSARHGIDGTGALEQDCGIEAGKSYRVTYTISSYVSGSCTVSLGGATGTARSANGTYSETLTATTTASLKLTCTNTARLYVDTVICEEFSWYMGQGWNLVSNKARKDEDGTGALEQNFTTVIGKSYTVTFTVSSYSVGSVTASIGGVSGTARSANGTYTETFTATNTDPLRLTGTNTARLYVDDIVCYENSWVLGTGWNKQSATIKKDVAGTGTLSQDFGIVANRYYTITFTLSSSTSVSLVPSIGGTNGTARTGNGTYTEVLKATNTSPLVFTPTDATRVTIDNIQVSDAWQYGTGWTTNGTQGNKSADGTGALEQAFVPVAGKSYTIVYTVSSWTVGTVTASIGGVTGTARGANGTYTETFTASDTTPLRFIGTNTSRLNIDSVYAYDVSPWVLGTGWNYASNLARKDIDGTGILTQPLTIVAGRKYCLTFTISSYSVGSVTPSIGGTNGTSRSANGTYTEIITASDTTSLKFTPTNTARFYIDQIFVDTDWMHGAGWQHVKNSLGNGSSIATWVNMVVCDDSNTFKQKWGNVDTGAYHVPGIKSAMLTATSDSPAYSTVTVGSPTIADDGYAPAAHHNASGSGSLEQQLTLIPGLDYTVSFGIQGWASGEGVYFTLGGVTGTPAASNGIHSQIITAIDADTSLKFYTLNSGDDIGIYNISVTSIDQITGAGGGGEGGVAGELGTETPPASIYGNYQGTVEFKFIRLQAMADHVLAHMLLESNFLPLICRFPVFWEHFDLGVGDTFDISSGLYNAKKFYIEKFRKLDNFRAEVQALEWW